MKKSIFNRVISFIVASLMALGMITILPEECLPQIVIRAAAEESYLYIKNIEQINPDTSITINWVYFNENSSIGKMNIDVHHSENFIWNGDEELYIYIYGIVTGSNTYKKIGTVGSSGFGSSTIGFMVDGPTVVSPTITYSDIYFDLGYKHRESDGGKSFVSCTKVYTSTKQTDEDNDNDNNDNIITSGQCGDNAYWKLTNDGTLTISGTGSIYAYDSYTYFGGEDYTTAPWWAYRKQIFSIVVESGITKITDYAFHYLNYTENITFDEGISTIGGYNFCCGKALKKVTIPKSVTSIGKITCWGSSINNQLTFYGYNGSYAKNYAEENKIPFVTLDDEDTNTEITYNNHKYKLFDDSMTWDEAKDYCESLDGHLLTITSAEEQAAIIPLAKKSTKKNIWLGAELISGNFVWITGETFNYTNWNTGEPNNVFNSQNTIMMYTYSGKNSDGYTITPGVWNDESKNGRNWTGYRISDTGFICEWDSDEEINSGYIKLNPLNDDGISINHDESILAYVYDNNNNRLSNVDLVWTSSNENIVAITAANNLGATIKGVSAGTATITCTDKISGFIGEIKINVQSYSIRFNSQEQNKLLKFDYSDTYFEKDAHEYNQKLAQASLALELSSFTTYGNENWVKNANTNREKNLYDAFITLGFDKESMVFKNYDCALSDGSDKVAFGIANKQIVSSDGKVSTLVAVAVRGGGYGAEWASNFRIGNNKKYALGFWDSSTGVYNYINEYVDNLKIPKENIKIWIVGFSRGAAVANLTAARLCQNYDTKNIFAYTFATPQGYVFDENEINKDISYSNIHNIINPADLVPTVALSNWGFGRFGLSYYFKNQRNNTMNNIYVNLMGKPYDYNAQYPAKVYELDDFLLNFLAHDTNVYTKNLQDIIVQALKDSNSEKDMAKGGINTLVFKIISQYIIDNSMPYQIEEKNNDILVFVNNWKNQQFGDNSPSTIETVARLYSISNITEIFNQHYPEVYIAWLFSSNDNNSIFSSIRYKSAIIDCPVDVYVYDSNSILVASIINNKIVKEDVNCAVFGDQKRVYLYDDTYSIKLVGNDSGTMDYSIEEHDNDGRMTRRVSYYDLPLENGTTYTGIINDTINTPINSYDLTSDYDVYNADFDSNNSTSEPYSITVNGGLSSKPFAYPGEQVTITALASNDTSVFSKWTTFSQIIFDDARMPVSTFIMPNEDVEIIALANQVIDDNDNKDNNDSNGNNNDNNTPINPSIDNSNHGNQGNQFSYNNLPTSTTFNVKIENKITGETNKAKATRTGENVTVDVGNENNGYYSNIYTTDGNLIYSVKIESGKVKFKIQPDIDFYIIIDKDSHIEYEDVSSGAGIYELFENKKEPFCMFVVIIAALGFSSIIIVKRFAKKKR